MENRHRPAVGAVASRASGHAERMVALHLVAPHADRPNPIALGADEGFDARDSAAEPREVNVTPHPAQSAGRNSGPHS